MMFIGSPAECVGKLRSSGSVGPSSAVGKSHRRVRRGINKKGGEKRCRLTQIFNYIPCRFEPFQAFILRAKANCSFGFQKHTQTVRAHSPILEDGEDGEGGSVRDDTGSLVEREVVADSATVEKRRKHYYQFQH